MSARTLLAFVVLFAFAFEGSYASIGCLDQNGNPVDWWVMFKVPYLPDSSDSVASTGYAYAYSDVNSPSLTYNSLALTTNSSNALAHTLTQIYTADTSVVGWIMYNDESPDGSTHSSYGHTKGDLAFDSDTGFWLVHSVPRWPDAPPSHYFYPDNEKDYGQSLMCMSFPLQTFNQIGELFLLNKPAIYSSSLTQTQEIALPNMVSVLEKDFNTKYATSTKIDLYTNGGVLLRSFAKNAVWNQSLYEDLAAPGIQSGLLVETWQNGSGGKMPSFCTPEYAYDSMNILEITFSGPVSWSHTKDHSKYGVSYDVENWVCIGDINRMYSQNNRAGGTYCFQNNALWSSINGYISNADYC